MYKELSQKYTTVIGDTSGRPKYIEIIDNKTKLVVCSYYPTLTNNVIFYCEVPMMDIGYIADELVEFSNYYRSCK